MRAIRLHAFGPASNLVLEEIPDPEPGEGQVRIRVGAAGVHAVDTAIRRGQAPPTLPAPRLPAVPGREVAGTVDLTGPGVDPAWTGERVVAHLGTAGDGGYLELALAPVAALHRIPDGVSDAVAVGQIGTGRTAQWVMDAADVGEGDVVIVPGSSGGLGNQLVQLVAARKATAVGLYGGAAKQHALEGLDVTAVDGTVDGWPQRLLAELGGTEPTHLLDGVGGAVGRAALELLGRGGRVVIFGWSSGSPTEVTTADIVERALTVSGILGRAFPDIRTLETRALAAAADSTVRPLIDPYPLTEAWRAHEAIEQRRSLGKVVLVP